MRKHGISLQKTKLRISVSTKLIWASCYDIGLCYAYATNTQFNRIETCIRKVVKAAGLDWMTKSDIIYLLSTRLPPRSMAIKQILQLGIKFLDPEEVRRKRFNIPRTDTDSLKPFWKVFIEEYEKLPLTLREKIINLLEPTNRAQMSQIKVLLKSHFLKQAYPNGEPNPTRIDNLIKSNTYSHLVIEERKRKYQEELQRVNFTTPTAKRRLLSSKLNMKQIAKCLAPRVSKCPGTARACPNSYTIELHRGPGKNKEPPDKTETPVRYLKRNKLDINSEV